MDRMESLLAGGVPSQHFDVFARENTIRPASWVVCWSDLMMTMFIMFAALYIFQIPKIQYKVGVGTVRESRAAGDRNRPPPPADGSILDRIHDRLRDLIARDALQAVVSVRSIPGKSLHVVLSGEMLFERSGAVLRGDAKKRLLAVGEILGRAPHVLSVVGHSAPGESAFRIWEPLGAIRGPWPTAVAGS
jgi:chemotaxis protein MotB